MKEKINKICLTASMVTGLICFTGCSDDFLKDKKVYGSYDASVVYENYETAKSRVDFLYQSLLPSSTGGSNALTDITSAGIFSSMALLSVGENVWWCSHCRPRPESGDR